MLYASEKCGACALNSARAWALERAPADRFDPAGRQRREHDAGRRDRLRGVRRIGAGRFDADAATGRYSCVGKLVGASQRGGARSDLGGWLANFTLAALQPEPESHRKMWSTVKALLRAAKARTQEELHAAIRARSKR